MENPLISGSRTTILPKIGNDLAPAAARTRSARSCTRSGTSAHTRPAARRSTRSARSPAFLNPTPQPRRTAALRVWACLLLMAGRGSWKTVVASGGDGCVLGLAVGRRWRGAAPSVRAGGPAGPGGAFVDRAGEQVVQHLVRLRDARLRDPLHCGMRRGGSGVPPEGLR